MLSSSELLNLMSCIEGAKKLGTIIDVIQMSSTGQDTAKVNSLEQISLFTQGAFLQVSENIEYISEYFKVSCDILHCISLSIA